MLILILMLVRDGLGLVVSVCTFCFTCNLRVFILGRLGYLIQYFQVLFSWRGLDTVTWVRLPDMQCETARLDALNFNININDHV